MTPAEIAAKWAPLSTTIAAIAADFKGLTLGLASTLTAAQVDERVDAKIATWTSIAPTAYSTFTKLAQEMADDDTEFSTLATVVGGKADLPVVSALANRVSDTEAILNGLPNLLDIYNAAKV
jgi:hypothetical protein